MEKRRFLLFTGGNLGEWALAEIKTGDFLVGVDRGALFLLQHNRKPNISLGDFDSVTTEEAGRIQALSGNFLSCDPVMKDLTDTEMAFAWALEQKPAGTALGCVRIFTPSRATSPSGASSTC